MSVLRQTPGKRWYFQLVKCDENGDVAEDVFALSLRDGARTLVAAGCNPASVEREVGDRRLDRLADVTPHVCRHTSASWLMLAGPKLRDAADYLGMTEDTLRTVYGHLHPDIFADVRAAFDGGSVRAAFARAKAAAATTNSPPKPVNRSRTAAAVRAKKAH